ncbi:hypothetical protein N9A97_00315 [bacterium]|nr:hypothetical protein [Akkermansiaceae bacterium]MDA7898498.1 hypothetical protein [bacterium]MDA8967326.1 hypothetical protein [Akkermansiaceae bacterium]MDB4458221.1 hypothetical protein [Akkermansiaceae bacterium]MDB4462793.1 hypothetical protein [Akkermansiaceae bacterium]
MWDNVIVNFIQEYFWIQVILGILGGAVLMFALACVVSDWGFIGKEELTIFACIFALGSLLLAPVVVPKFIKNRTQAAMMESCFEIAPSLRTTLNNLEAEIDKWESTKKKFSKMKNAAQTTSGRSLAESKLFKIENVLSDLNDQSDVVLGQIEVIAMESEGQFTELDKKALEDLGRKVEDSIQNARDLSDALAK